SMASRMSFSAAVVLRLDIDDALPDALRDFIDPDAVDAIRSQHFDLSAKELFKLANEPEEVVVRRMLELHKKIDVALMLWRAFRVGPEKSDPFDRILPQQRL